MLCEHIHTRFSFVSGSEIEASARAAFITKVRHKNPVNMAFLSIRKLPRLAAGAPGARQTGLTMLQADEAEHFSLLLKEHLCQMLLALLAWSCVKRRKVGPTSGM